MSYRVNREKNLVTMLKTILSSLPRAVVKLKTFAKHFDIFFVVFHCNNGFAESKLSEVDWVAVRLKRADQVMYFDNYVPHTFHVLNLTGSTKQQYPLTLLRVGSVTPFAIAVDADFIYLSNQHPRCVLLHIFKSVVGEHTGRRRPPGSGRGQHLPPLFLSVQCYAYALNRI